MQIYAPLKPKAATFICKSCTEMASSATKNKNKNSCSNCLCRITLCKRIAASIRSKLHFQCQQLILAFIQLFWPTFQPYGTEPEGYCMIASWSLITELCTFMEYIYNYFHSIPTTSQKIFPNKGFPFAAVTDMTFPGTVKLTIIPIQPIIVYEEVNLQIFSK